MAPRRSPAAWARRWRTWAAESSRLVAAHRAFVADRPHDADAFDAAGADEFLRRELAAFESDILL